MLRYLRGTVCNRMHCRSYCGASVTGRYSCRRLRRSAGRNRRKLQRSVCPLVVLCGKVPRYSTVFRIFCAWRCRNSRRSRRARLSALLYRRCNASHFRQQRDALGNCATVAGSDYRRTVPVDVIGTHFRRIRRSPAPLPRARAKVSSTLFGLCQNMCHVWCGADNLRAYRNNRNLKYTFTYFRVFPDVILQHVCVAFARCRP